MATDILTPAPSEPTEPVTSSRRRKPSGRTGYTREPTGVRWTLRIIAVVYVVMLVAWPTYLVFQLPRAGTLDRGSYRHRNTNPDHHHRDTHDVISHAHPLGDRDGVLSAGGWGLWSV